MIFVLTLTIPAEWPVIVPECHFKTHEVDFNKTNYKKLMKRIELKAKGTGMLKLLKMHEVAKQVQPGFCTFF